MMMPKKAQSTLEFTILLIIIIGSFVAMQAYIKRGFQGRWKTSVDDFGEQYDPRLTNANMVYRTMGNSFTQIQTIKDVNGYWTLRTDNTLTNSTTTGSVAVGASY